MLTIDYYADDALPNFFSVRPIDMQFRDKVSHIQDGLPYWFRANARHRAAIRQAYWELGYKEEAERYK